MFERRGRQKQHVASKPLRASVTCRARQCIEIFRTIGDPGKNRHSQHSCGDSSFIQSAHRLQTQIWPWRARLEHARKPRAHGGDAQVHHQRGTFRNPLQQIDVV